MVTLKLFSKDFHVQLILTCFLLADFGCFKNTQAQYDTDTNYVVVDDPLPQWGDNTMVDQNGNPISLADEGEVTYVSEDDMIIGEPPIGDFIYDTTNDIITEIPGTGESITEEYIVVDGDGQMDGQDYIVVDGTEIPIDTNDGTIINTDYDYGNTIPEETVIIYDDEPTFPPWVPETTTWPPWYPTPAPTTTWPPWYPTPTTTWPPWPTAPPTTTWPPWYPPTTTKPSTIYIINNGTVINGTDGVAPIIINNYNTYNYYNNTTVIKNPVKTVRGVRQGRNLNGQKKGNRKRLAVNGNGTRRRFLTRRLITRNLGRAGGAGNVQVYRVIRAKNAQPKVIKLRKQNKQNFRTLNRRQAARRPNTAQWRVVPKWKAQKMQRLGMNVKIGQLQQVAPAKQKGLKIIRQNNNNIVNNSSIASNTARKLKFNNNVMRMNKKTGNQFGISQLSLGLENRLKTKPKLNKKKQNINTNNNGNKQGGRRFVVYQ